MMRDFLRKLRILGLCFFAGICSFGFFASEGNCAPKDIPIVAQLDNPKAQEWSDADLRELVSHYAGVSDRSVNFSPEQIQRMKELDPDFFILKYISFTTLHGQKKIQKSMQKYPDAVLRDPEGNPVPPIWSPKSGRGVTMNIGHPEWQKYLIKESRRFIEQGYDGIMADETFMVNDLPKWFKGINPRTGRVYSTRDWSDQHYQNLAAVKDALGEGHYVIANSVAYGSRYFEKKAGRFLDVVDGVVAEGYRGPESWPAGRVFEGKEWKDNVEMLIDVNRRGGHMIATIKYNAGDLRKLNSAQKRQCDLFHLATFLMGKGETTYLSTVEFDPRDPTGGSRKFLDIWNAPIGDPQGEYFQEQGVYQRNFEYARVMVNPGRRSYRVDLEKPYLTLDGESVSEITLEPHAGVILLKKE